VSSPLGTVALTLDLKSKVESLFSSVNSNAFKGPLPVDSSLKMFNTTLAAERQMEEWRRINENTISKNPYVRINTDGSLLAQSV
jgi:hypothetical protein